MSKLSQHLRRMAAAQRVSMETADETVQGQDGNLSEEELAKIAAKAQETVEPAEGEAATDDTAATDSSVQDTTADADADALVIPDAPEGDAGESGSDDAATGTETPAEAEAAADDIQTPAETEMANDLTASAQEVVDAEAAADSAVGTDTAGETTGDPTVDGATSDASTDPLSTDIPVEGGGTSEVSADGDSASAGDTAGPQVDDATSASDAAVDASTDAQATDVATEEPQAPAAAPSANTDTSEAVQEVVELTEALASAQSAEEVVKEANEVRDDLQEVVDTTTVINENGGVTMESLALLIPAVNYLGRRMGRRSVNLGVSMESFEGQQLTARLQVSTEEIELMVDEIDVSLPQLERQAIQSLDRVVCALRDALPAARERLKAVLSLANNSSDEREGVPVQVGDGLSSALSINGAMPDDLANELQTYAQLGRTIIGPYSDAAMRAAKTASLINNAIVFSSPAAFWEKIGNVVDVVVDPRTTMTRTQLESGLPGGTCLFGEATPPMEATNKVLQSLFEYNGNYQPLESAVVVKGGGDANATYPAMSASKIALVGKALLEVLCCDTIDRRLSDGQKLWPEAQDTLRHLKENLSNPPQEIDHECGADFSQLQKFVEVNYSLATWPLLNYLTNLVLTTNAFVLFAERSLKAEQTTEVDTSTQTDPDAINLEPEIDLEVSTEGLKEVVGFITSKEKRLIWSLKKMPDDLAEARAEMTKAKQNLAIAKKNGKVSEIKKAENDLAIWADEVEELELTQTAFKEELARIQAKRKEKK